MLQVLPTSSPISGDKEPRRSKPGGAKSEVGREPPTGRLAAMMLPCRQSGELWHFGESDRRAGSRSTRFAVRQLCGPPACGPMRSAPPHSSVTGGVQHAYLVQRRNPPLLRAALYSYSRVFRQKDRLHFQFEHGSLCSQQFQNLLALIGVRGLPQSAIELDTIWIEEPVHATSMGDRPPR